MAIRLLYYFLASLLTVTLVAFAKTAGHIPSPSILVLIAGMVGLCMLVFLHADALGFLCVILMFLPYSEGVLRFEFGIITFSVFTMGVIASALNGLFRLMLGATRFRLHGVDVALFLLCVLFLSTTLTSPDLLGSGFLAFHAVFIPVLAVLAIRLTANGQADVELLLRSLLTGIISFVILALMHEAMEPSRLSFLNVPAVSVATLALVPLIFFAASRRYGILSRIAVVVLCLLAIFFTFSRVYLIVLILSPLLLKMIRKGWSSHIFIVFSLITLILTFTFSMTVPQQTVDAVIKNNYEINYDEDYIEGSSSYERLYSPKQWIKSFEFRLLSYRIGLEHFFNNPVFGSGLVKGERMVTQHNFHIEWLEYGGILGYMLYFSLFISFFAKFGPKAVHDDIQSYCNLIVLIILINSLTNGFMHGFFPYVTFLVFGLSFARVSIKTHAPRSPHTPEPAFQS